MGKGEIPDFLKGKQEQRGGGQQEEQNPIQALMQGIDMLGQNQQQLGAANAITQQALMFQFQFLVNAMVEERSAKQAYLEAFSKILQGEDPQEVHEELRRELTSPSIVTPGG